MIGAVFGSFPAYKWLVTIADPDPSAVLGADEVLNPATYLNDEPCRLRTPWLAAGIEGCAVALDPLRAKPILDWAPGNLAAMDHRHADELVDMGVDPRRHRPDLVLNRLRQLYGPGWWR